MSVQHEQKEKRILFVKGSKWENAVTSTPEKYNLLAFDAATTLLALYNSSENIKQGEGGNIKFTSRNGIQLGNEATVINLITNGHLQQVYFSEEKCDVYFVCVES
ncbi:hypothetical protein GGH13_009309 [Coemansia sp. S155-1]|nr:hypothetical protein GGH13_009309 [Coemansia sp. S155-1]